MKNDENFFFFFLSKKCQKASGRPLEASEGLGKASRRFLAHGSRCTKTSKKFTKSAHVDGAPSTAPSFRRPVDFSSRKSSRNLGRSMERHRRVVRSTLCELFGFFYAGSHAQKVVKRPSGGLRRPPGAFRMLSEAFSRKIKISIFSSFFMKVQHKIFVCHGRSKFVNNFI